MYTLVENSVRECHDALSEMSHHFQNRITFLVNQYSFLGRVQSNIFWCEIDELFLDAEKTAERADTSPVYKTSLRFWTDKMLRAKAKVAISKTYER